MSLAIYRKYRPASFSDIIGQEMVVKILKETAKQNKFSHAYLFTGPRGTGKTSMARLIAKAANCEKRLNDKEFQKQGEPCNKCQTCKDIDAGRNLDIIEIDAASNRGIDEIRNLRENVRIPPSSSKYKVFIIDEAHMLTRHAFNALLKTIEEPPEHIIMILATTEAEKVPSTISSRTQQFHFKLVPLKMVVEKLKEIVKKEKLSVSEETLELIASSAEGSFRDAESLLDQLISSGDKKMTTAKVEEMIGKVGFDKVGKVAEILIKENIDEVLKLISEIEEEGYNLAQFNKELIKYLRRAAILSFAPAMEDLFKKELTENHLEKLKKNAEKFEKKHLELLKNLIEAYGQMRYSQFPIIPLEIAIIEFLKNS